jgi:hypothetical protein
LLKEDKGHRRAEMGSIWSCTPETALLEQAPAGYGQRCDARSGAENLARRSCQRGAGFDAFDALWTAMGEDSERTRRAVEKNPLVLQLQGEVIAESFDALWTAMGEDSERTRRAVEKNPLVLQAQAGAPHPVGPPLSDASGSEDARQDQGNEVWRKDPQWWLALTEYHSGQWQ